MKMHSILAAAALAVTASVASAAVDDVPCATVAYSDLNLKSAAGATAFRQRVDRTVVSLSGGDAARNRPDVAAARQRARLQADAVIGAAA